ncbi:MAG: CDP-alcohol phosphatidyltransferase family protein [Phycisphaerae bacterium]
MLGPLIVRTGDRLFISATSRLRRLGLKPLAANVLEVGAGILAAGLFASGMRLAGLAALILHGGFDYLDGALARAGAKGSSIRRHALTDKLSEVIIFTGLAFGGLVPFWLSFAVIAAVIGTTWLGLYGWKKGARREQAVFDRSERLMALILLGVFADLSFGAWTNLAMALAVCGQRLANRPAAVSRCLRQPASAIR